MVRPILIVGLVLMLFFTNSVLFSILGDNIFTRIWLDSRSPYFIKTKGWISEAGGYWEVIDTPGKNYGYLYFKLPHPDKDKIFKIRCTSWGKSNILVLYASRDGKDFEELFRVSFYGKNKEFLIYIPKGYEYFCFYLKAVYCNLFIYKDMYYVTGQSQVVNLDPNSPNVIGKGGDIEFDGEKWLVVRNGNTEGYLVVKIPSIEDNIAFLIFDVYNRGESWLDVYGSKDNVNYKKFFATLPTGSIDKKSYIVLLPDKYEYIKFELSTYGKLGLYKNINVFVVELLPKASIEVVDIIGYSVASVISIAGVLLILVRIFK